MAQGGDKGIRAAFVDATGGLVPSAELVDHPIGDKDLWGYAAGQWVGAPADRLPKGCPVRPLGRADGIYYFFDSMKQLNPVKRADFNKKTLLDLFALCPNYLYHHWPRWNAKTLTVNGLEVDDAIQCLMKASALEGVFSLSDVVRGRGMWLTDTGRLIWHGGDVLYTIDKGKLKASSPGMIEGDVYPGAARVLAPWAQPVDPSDSPVHEILKILQTWTWERPSLDPVLVIGWLGCAFLGAALPWRPTLFITGDKRVGKSTMQNLLRAVYGNGLIKAANTTAAGVYQHVRQDVLPVLVDELEAKADDKRGPALIELARLSASGDDMLRGGADHAGVRFTLRNTFAFSAINPPPMEPADKQRMIFLNLHKLRETKAPGELMLGHADGRMILRAVMDAWPTFDKTWRFWREALKEAGFDDRGTYGVALAVANMLLGDEAMEAAGLAVTEPKTVGAMVAAATAEERAEHGDNWSDCLMHALGYLIDAWKSGERVTVGSAIEKFEADLHQFEIARSQLALAGLGLRNLEPAIGEFQRLLCVPTKATPLLNQVFKGTKWAYGGWVHALKQGPPDIVIRDRGNAQKVKINRVTTHCLLIDLGRFDAAMAAL